MKTLNTILLLTFFTLAGCSTTNINRNMILGGELIHQTQKGKKGILEIQKFKPNNQQIKYFYTETNPPKLDSLKTNKRTYTRETTLGANVLDYEQINLRSYLKDLKGL